MPPTFATLTSQRCQEQLEEKKKQGMLCERVYAQATLLACKAAMMGMRRRLLGAHLATTDACISTIHHLCEVAVVQQRYLKPVVLESVAADEQQE